MSSVLLSGMFGTAMSFCAADRVYVHVFTTAQECRTPRICNMMYKYQVLYCTLDMLKRNTCYVTWHNSMPVPLVGEQHVQHVIARAVRHYITPAILVCAIELYAVTMP